MTLKIKKLFTFFCPFTKQTSFYSVHLSQLKRLNTDLKCQIVFHLYKLTILLKSTHFLYLFFAPLDRLTRLLHFDLETFLVGRGPLNPDWSMLLINFYAQSLFFYNGKTTAKLNNDLLERIVFGGECSFFFINYDLPSMNQNFCLVIRQKLLLFYNGAQTFMLVIKLMIPLTTALIFRLLWSEIPNNMFTKRYFLYCLAHFTAHALLQHLLLLSFAFILSRIIALGATQMTILKLKCKQIRSFLLANFHRHQRHDHFYAFYKRHTVQLLRLFTEYNSFYGLLFAVYLATNVPVNVHCTLSLLYGALEPVGALYLYAYTAMQAFGFLAAHFYFVRFTEHFHAPSAIIRSSFMRLQNCRRKEKDLRNRLAMANSIQAMCTKKPYGMTYYHFGRVTLQTFVKVNLKKRDFCDF